MRKKPLRSSEGSRRALALHFCASASSTGTAVRHERVPVQGPASIRQRAEEWLQPSFRANDSASESHTPAGCSVRDEAANGLAARARYRCRTCDAREVHAHMLGMYCAHPEIPCLDVLRQAPASMPTLPLAQSSRDARARRPSSPSSRATRVVQLRGSLRNEGGCAAPHRTWPPCALLRQLRCGSGLKAARVASCRVSVASP